MKYIRTKTGVYKEFFKDSVPNGLLYYIEINPKTKSWKKITDKSVVKQSDNILELCDEFVCESNEEGDNFFKTYKDIWLMLRDDFWTKYKEHYNFYAGIRVKGKGLIYVAKLNDKGELELI